LFFKTQFQLLQEAFYILCFNLFILQWFLIFSSYAYKIMLIQVQAMTKKKKLFFQFTFFHFFLLSINLFFM